jgi:hypothetical protein
MADIVFADPNNPIVPDLAIVHDNESFRVQWSAFNAGEKDVPSFLDRLVITSIPEGCPGSDDIEHDVVFDESFDDGGLAAGTAGDLIEAEVGPFAAGSYRLTVTLADDLGTGFTTFNCIEIVKAT